VRHFAQLEQNGLSPKEAAHILGIGRTNIYRLVKDGKLRHVKVGSRIIIPRKEVQRLLAGREVRGDQLPNAALR
jgi:excisionase family DNA binding protein